MNATASTTREISVGESGLGPYGQIIVAGRHVMSADESEALGGRDTGPDPFELVMSGLGACTAMTMRMYAERKKWPLVRSSVQVRHSKITGADGKPLDRFERVITMEGDLSEEQRQRLLEIANRCPVHETLTRGSEVQTSLA
ncbi:OsmC family protein [Ferrovibrio sp.]|uniref:OsmC family protein n=1 Tax=Ferrovibrio sp. TaxID=1917215 RepID=UPI0026381872|nr:OsmC family protein [Ferrovibrio sp.]